MSAGSTMDEVLKQDSLGRVRTPLEKRIAIVEAFEGGGMSAARFGSSRNFVAGWRVP
jgi:hypothetical protein